MLEINEELTIEQVLARMEEIQSVIENGEISLKDSVKLFEEAAKLYEFCNGNLDALEDRVKILAKTVDGKLEKIPFEAQE